MSDPLHYSSTIAKINSNGVHVLSNFLEEGESLEDGTTYADLTGGKATLPAAESVGGAAFLTAEARREIIEGREIIPPLGIAEPGQSSLTVDEPITSTVTTEPTPQGAENPLGENHDIEPDALTLDEDKTSTVTEEPAKPAAKRAHKPKDA